MKETIDFEAAVVHPAQAFKRPADVVSARELSRDQKIRILEAWEADERLLMTATEENMGGGEQPRLPDVQKALRDLGIEPSELEGAGTAKTGH